MTRWAMVLTLAAVLAGCATAPAAPDATPAEEAPAATAASPAKGAPPAAAGGTPSLRKLKGSKLVQVSRLPDDSIKLALPTDNLFEYGSARPTPGSRDTLQRIADALRACDRIVVHVVGHTDNFGTSEVNRWLSHQRASSVAFYLEQSGVSREFIRVEGRGSSEPLVSNLTAAGSKANRRVDIVVRPLWPGREREAYASPPNLGKAR